MEGRGRERDGLVGMEGSADEKDGERERERERERDVERWRAIPGEPPHDEQCMAKHARAKHVFFRRSQKVHRVDRRE